MKKSIKSKNQFKWIPVLLIGVFGVFLLSRTLAASWSVSVESENQSSVLSGSVVKYNDATASGGGAIMFGQQQSTSGMPAKFVGGYLESWSGVYPSEINQKYTLLFHAFATVNGDGSLNLDLSVDRTRLANEYKAMKAQGKTVILSVGGAGGAQSGLNSSSEIQNFINSVNPLISEFGFSGVDWDLELGVPGGISINGLVSASRQLKAQHGAGFAITMAPFEGVEYPYKDIARALGNDLTSVGFQFYNMEQKVSAQNAIARMEEWMNDCNLRPDQFSIGLWYGPDDWQRYTVDESLMASIYSAVEAKYPTVRGTWTWGIASTDRPRGYAFANAMHNVAY